MTKRKNVRQCELIKAKDFVKKEFGIRMRRIRYGGSGAICDQDTIEIDISECKTDDMMWSFVFHEVSHILCYRHKIWIKYHDETWGTDIQIAKYVRRNGLRIERFVDKKAKKLMKQYFPKKKYTGAYDTEENVRWYRKWVNKNYPKT